MASRKSRIDAISIRQIQCNKEHSICMFKQSVPSTKNNITSRVIVWPSQERAQVIMDSFRRHRGLPGMIGAVDGSHITIKAPEECPENYVNRKNFHSVNLTAICDHEMRFLNCYAGWPGNVHDSRVFKNSDFNQTVGDKFQDNSYLLGGSTYTLETWMIVQQQRFNFIHSSTRMVIERAFSLLKRRFRRLKYLDMSRIHDIPMVIIATCTLHNILYALTVTISMRTLWVILRRKSMVSMMSCLQGVVQWTSVMN